MNNLLRIIVLLAITLTSAIALGADDVNLMCPVLSDEEAIAEIFTIYQGKEVRFCCNECKQEFIDNPEIYLSVLPHLQEVTWYEELVLLMDGNTRLIACGVLVLLLVASWLYRWWKPPVESTQEPTWLGSLTSRRIPPAIPLAVLCGLLGIMVYNLRAEAYDHWMEDHMHYATFYDFGYPPVPPHPPLEPRLSGSYYRGNDERSERLFNNGNYRTGTLSVSIVDGDGTTIEPGDDLAGRDLFVRLEIDRPPFTPDFLYSPKVMSSMFLTQESDKFLGRHEPVADRINMNTVEEMQKWEALYPIGRLCPHCADGKRGIVYVCEEYYHQPHWWTSREVRGGARFHYGIQYELRATADGQLADTSDVWMGALYRTRKFPKWKVPMEEWFSHEPIPVLPDENIEDSELLGIDDHLARFGE